MSGLQPRKILRHDYIQLDTFNNRIDRSRRCADGDADMKGAVYIEATCEKCGSGLEVTAIDNGTIEVECCRDCLTTAYSEGHAANEKQLPA